LNLESSIFKPYNQAQPSTLSVSAQNCAFHRNLVKKVSGFESPHLIEFSVSLRWSEAINNSLCFILVGCHWNPTLNQCLNINCLMNIMTRECYCCYKKLYNLAHIPRDQEELDWFVARSLCSRGFLFLMAKLCYIVIYLCFQYMFWVECVICLVLVGALC